MTLIKCSIVNCGHSALEEKYTSAVGRTHFLKKYPFHKIEDISETEETVDSSVEK